VYVQVATRDPGGPAAAAWPATLPVASEYVAVRRIEGSRVPAAGDAHRIGREWAKEASSGACVRFHCTALVLRPAERYERTRPREFRDAQEERWQAYLVARGVAREPASSPATVREALRLAIDCLDRINTDRFGRAREIERDKTTLVAHLRSLR
jgi:hypothetical protein